MAPAMPALVLEPGQSRGAVLSCRVLSIPGSSLNGSERSQISPASSAAERSGGRGMLLGMMLGPSRTLGMAVLFAAPLSCVWPLVPVRSKEETGGEPSEAHLEGGGSAGPTARHRLSSVQVYPCFIRAVSRTDLKQAPRLLSELQS